MWNKVATFKESLLEKYSSEFSTVMAPFTARVHNTVCVYWTSVDVDGRGSIFSAELCDHNGLVTHVPESTQIVLSGSNRLFDSDGVIGLQVVKDEKSAALLYTGFSRSKDSTYVMSTGAVKIDQDGQTFSERTQLLPPSPGENHFRASSNIFKVGEQWLMVYAAGNHFINVHGKVKPTYDLRFLWSSDLFRWGNEGTLLLPTDDQFYAHGRPQIVEFSDRTITLNLSSRRTDIDQYQPRRLKIRLSADLQSAVDAKEVIGYFPTSTQQIGSYPFEYKDGDDKYLLIGGRDFGRDGFNVFQHKVARVQ